MTVVIAPLFPIQFGPKLDAKSVQIYYCHLLATEPPESETLFYDPADNYQWTASQSRIIICTEYQAPAFVKNFGWGQIGLVFWP
jgi:hypothetical protein